MKTSLIYGMPDRAFWDQYAALWNESLERPAFQGPHYMQFLADRERDHLAVFQYVSGAQLKGAAFFTKEHGAYGFLSDTKADYNYFVLHNSCTEAEIAGFFEQFFEIIHREHWHLILQKQSAAAFYSDLLIQTLKSGPLFWEISKQAVCPKISAATPDAVAAVLHGSKEAARKIRHLDKENKTCWIDFYTDETDLESWSDQYIDFHIRRWAGTQTPSKYAKPEEAQFLKDCLKAWSRDGVLRRFTLWVGVKKAALGLALAQPGAWILHGQCFNPEKGRYTPIKMLFHQIAGLVQEHNISTFDFGYGDDDYKFNYANNEVGLLKIFVSSRLAIPFIIRAKMTGVVKNNKKLLTLYRDLKHKCMSHE